MVQGRFGAQHRARQGRGWQLISNMELRDGLRTTGAVRVFHPESVHDSVVRDILDDARFAPSGGNRQPWRVAVVKDPTIRRSLANEMQSVWND